MKTISLKSPSDIVNAVPYMLGFAPTDSVVVIGLAINRAVLTARVDVADVELARMSITEALVRAGADRAILVGYGPANIVGPALRSMSLFPQAVMEAIVVDGGRWSSVDNEGRITGHGYVEAESKDVTTLADSAGPVLQSRADVVAECYPRAGIDSEGYRRYFEHLQESGRYETCNKEIVSAFLQVMGWFPGPGSVGTYLTAAYGLRNQYTRDLFYSFVAPAMLGESDPPHPAFYEEIKEFGIQKQILFDDGKFTDIEAQRKTLEAIRFWAGGLPDDLPELTEPVLVVAAVAHWYAGDGARARIYVERAFDLEVEHRAPMLRTIAAVLEHGVKPPA